MTKTSYKLSGAAIDRVTERLYKAITRNPSLSDLYRALRPENPSSYASAAQEWIWGVKQKDRHLVVSIADSAISHLRSAERVIQARRDADTSLELFTSAHDTAFSEPSND